MESASLRKIERQVALLSKGDQLALAAKLQELIAKSRAAEPPIDWSQFHGILKTEIDGVEYQRQIRDEW